MSSAKRNPEYLKNSKDGKIESDDSAYKMDLKFDIVIDLL